MNDKIQKFLRIFFYVLFGCALVFLISQLFFESSVNKIFIHLNKENALNDLKYVEDFKIVYPEEPLSLEPTLIDRVTRQVLLNVYEPLVRPDRDLRQLRARQ